MRWAGERRRLPELTLPRGRGVAPPAGGSSSRPARGRPVGATAAVVAFCLAVTAVTAVTAVAAPVASPAEAAALGSDPLRDAQWALDVLQAEAVWAEQRADGVVVAVVDTGIDPTHPDLVGRITPGWDAFTPETDGLVDPNGHGTGVAGIIGATVGNDIGMAGLASDVTIMPVRVLDRFRTGSVEDVEQGIRWAASHGADVINLSFGSADPAPAIRVAIDDATRAGAVVVASAGNSFSGDGGPRYPAADSDVVSVAAVDRELAHAWFSTSHATVDVAAPGEDVIMPSPGGSYLYDSGTSFSAPYVSAVAALLAARYPRATPIQQAERLTESARDLGPVGKDDYFGLGLLDPVAALGWEADAGCRAVAFDPLLRVWDDDRIGTSAAAACTFWLSGGAGHAVIARADAYPDALAGTPLAAVSDSPLLLTTSSALPPGVAQVLADLGVRDVTVLGGASAIDLAVDAQLAAIGIRVARIFGDDRYATAAQVARRVGGESGTAIVVTGDGFADAVAAGAYTVVGAPPVLLTDHAEVPESTLAALTELQPDEIVLVGGPQAVSQAAADRLAGVAPVRRVAGSDRYATSAAVLADVRSRTQADGEAPVVLATGAAFPDALAAGAVTGRLGGSLLLVKPNDAQGAATIVEDGPWSTGVVLGGTAAVSAADAQVLGAALAGEPAVAAGSVPATGSR